MHCSLFGCYLLVEYTPARSMVAQVNSYFSKLIYKYYILTFWTRYIIGLKSKGLTIPPFELDFPPHLYINNSLKCFAINL